MSTSLKLSNADWLQEPQTLQKTPEANTDLSTVIFNLSKRLELTQSEILHSRSEIRMRELRIETLEFRNEELTKSKSFYESKITGLQEMISEESQSRKQQELGYQNKIEALEQEIKHLLQAKKTQLDELKAKLSLLENANCELQNEIQKQAKESSKYQAQLTSQRRQHQGLQTSINHVNHSLKQQADENLKLRSENENLRLLVCEKDGSLSRLTSKIQQLETQLETQKASVPSLQEQVKALEAKLESEQKLKESLYVTMIQQIETRLSKEEKKNLLLAAVSKRPSHIQASPEEETLQTIRDWMIRISE